MSRTTTVSSTMSPSMAGLLDHQRASIARLGPGGPSPWPDSAARTAAPRWSPRAQRADHTVESPGSHAPAPRIAVLRADLLRLARRRRRLRHDGYRRQRAHRVLAPVPADPRGVRLAARAHRRSLIDRRGPRAVMLLGVAMVGAGLGLAPLVKAPWHLYLTLGVLVAGGTVCLGYTGHALFLPNWFVRRRGLAIGIAFSGVGVGSIVILPWLQRLIAGYGWRTACLAMAALVILALTPLNLLTRRRPEDMGLHPDGDRAPETAGRGGRHPANVVDQAWASIDWTLARAIRTARFWWISVGFFGGLWAWYAVQVHQTKYLIEIGFAPAVAAYALGFVGFTGVVGQIALGHLSDRIGREWVWTLACAGFGLRRDSRGDLPGPALRDDLRHAQPDLDHRRRDRPLAHRRALRPHRRLRAGVLAVDRRQRRLRRGDLDGRSATRTGGGGSCPPRFIREAQHGHDQRRDAHSIRPLPRRRPRP